MNQDDLTLDHIRHAIPFIFIKGDNMNHADLTLDQIRYAIPFLLKNSKAAFEAGSTNLADMIQRNAESLWAELVRRIQAEDPHTTEADIRYFEGINI